LEREEEAEATVERIFSSYHFPHPDSSIFNSLMQTMDGKIERVEIHNKKKYILSI